MFVNIREKIGGKLGLVRYVTNKEGEEKSRRRSLRRKGFRHQSPQPVLKVQKGWTREFVED